MSISDGYANDQLNSERGKPRSRRRLKIGITALIAIGIVGYGLTRVVDNVQEAADRSR